MSDWTWLVYLQSAPLASDNSHRTNKYLRNKHLQSVLLHIKLVSEYFFETFVWSFSCIKKICCKISSHTFAQNNHFWWSWLILRIDCVVAFILAPSTFTKKGLVYAATLLLLCFFPIETTQYLLLPLNIDTLPYLHTAQKSCTFVRKSSNWWNCVTD